MVSKRQPAVFRHCYACGHFGIKRTIEDQHYPVPARHGGRHTIPLCRTCHDLSDRLNVMKWPKGCAEEGVWEVHHAAPSLMTMWVCTSDEFASSIPGDCVAYYGSLAAQQRLPKTLSDVEYPESILIDIHDLGRYGRLFATKVLFGLFDRDPSDVPRWLPIQLAPDHVSQTLSISWDSAAA
jgi:hypothetical protein